MKFLAVSTNTKDITPFIEAETQRLNELRADGTVTDGWIKADFSGAALIVEAADAAAASAALGTLPIAANGATDIVLTAIVDLDAAASATH